MEKQIIQKARQRNLPEYLLNKGEKLIQTGNHYRHADHESLVHGERLLLELERRKRERR